MSIHLFIKLRTSKSRKRHTTLSQRRHSWKCYSGSGHCERLFITTSYIIYICNINWRCFHPFIFQLCSHGNSVNIVTTLWDGRPGFDAQQRYRVLLFAPRIYWLWGPLSLLSNGYLGIIPIGLQETEREADHSPPSSAHSKHAWSPMPYSPIRLWGVVLS